MLRAPRDANRSANPRMVDTGSRVKSSPRRRARADPNILRVFAGLASSQEHCIHGPDMLAYLRACQKLAAACKNAHISHQGMWFVSLLTVTGYSSVVADGRNYTQLRLVRVTAGLAWSRGRTCRYRQYAEKQ